MPTSQWLCVFLPLLITVCISIACVVDQDFIVQIITLLARLVIFTDQTVLYVARAERRAMVSCRTRAVPSAQRWKGQGTSVC